MTYVYDTEVSSSNYVYDTEQMLQSDFLLENSGLILLEDGSVLLVESSSGTDNYVFDSKP